MSLENDNFSQHRMSEIAICMWVFSRHKPEKESNTFVGCMYTVIILTQNTYVYDLSVLNVLNLPQIQS